MGQCYVRNVRTNGDGDIVRGDDHQCLHNAASSPFELKRCYPHFFYVVPHLLNLLIGQPKFCMRIGTVHNFHFYLGYTMNEVL
jgi:hypothetical protein